MFEQQLTHHMAGRCSCDAFQKAVRIMAYIIIDQMHLTLELMHAPPLSPPPCPAPFLYQAS